MKNLFITILLFMSCAVQAQDTTSSKRPVIGLCLSGGGAKGFSHIGVLEIIDSLNIPIDYVTGTSMGSIVGGLYAIGYTPKQIYDAVTQEDWEKLMSPDPDRKHENYGTKDLAERNLFTLGYKDWSIVLPSGLNNASKVTQKLHNETLGYHGYQDFLEFPRGFVCVAADLNHAEEVIISEGSLPDAMRASMSIPTAFVPYKYHGKTMVDGGTINNFPTDILQALGCDIIIGIDLQTASKDTVDISLTKVLEKTAMFINNSKTAERQALCDILIKPDLTGYSGKSFDKSVPIIALGKKAAYANLDQLVGLSEKMASYQKPEVPPYKPLDTVMIQDINTKGLQWVSRSFITGTIDVEPFERVSVSQLEESIAAIYGSGYFNQAAYNLLPATDSTYEMQVVVEEKDVDLEIGFGLHYDPDYATSFLINFSGNNTLFKSSHFNFDLVISEEPRFKMLYEVDRGSKLGFGIQSNLYLSRLSFYELRASQGTYRYDDWTTSLYGLMTFNNLAAIRFGVEYNNAYYNFKDVPSLYEVFRFSDSTLLPEDIFVTYHNFNLFTAIGIDVFDDINYPTRGYRFNISGRYHSSLQKSEKLIGESVNSQFMTFYAKYSSAASVSQWLTFIPELAGGLGLPISDQAEIPFNYLMPLGGLGKNYIQYQTPFLGFHQSELFYLQDFLKAGLEIRANPFKNHYVSAMANYAISSVPEGDVVPTLGVNDYAGWGVKYGFNSIIGPIELTAHKNVVTGNPNVQSGAWLFYFNLGFWF